MSAAAAPRNPFPGLRPFEPKDSTLFFGRDEQIGEALDRLLRQRMLVVVGVSGCGKSSLVGAGMVPALEMGLAGDSGQRWQVSTMRPGDGPLGELARCLGFGGGPLAQRTYGLSEAVETHLPAGDNLLLVVDQFEEIFPFRDRKLRESAGSEADLFVSYLLRASQDPAKRVYIVLTMRSDYLGECAKFHGLPEASNDGQYLVPRMTRRQLQEAIEGPLAAAGVEIHPPLVQDLLNQCDEEPDNLPLLQHLLRRIFEKWEEDGGQGSITAAMAEKVGGLAEALNLDAEAVYGKLAPEEQRAAEVLLRRITESRHTDRDGDDQPIRRPQRAEDLARLARVPEAVLGGIVRRFEERGLLVVRRTDEGDKIDLPHECLCLKWKRLKDWVRSEAEDAKKLRFIHDAVGKSYLTGLALAEALEWRNAGRLDSEWCLRYLIGEQRTGVVAWVEESERLVKEAAERDRRQQEKEIQQAKERSRRALRTAAFLGVAFLVVAAFGLYADYQRREAISARDVAETAKKQADDSRGQADDQRREAIGARDTAVAAKKQADDSRRQADERRNEAIIAHKVAEAERDKAEKGRLEADLEVAAADETLQSEENIIKVRACLAATDRVSKGLEHVASREFFLGRWHSVSSSGQTYMDWRPDGTCVFNSATLGQWSLNMKDKSCHWNYVRGKSDDEFGVDSDLNVPGFIINRLRFKIVNYNHIQNIEANYHAFRITCPAEELDLFEKQLAHSQQRLTDHPGDPERNRAVALNHNHVGDALIAQGGDINKVRTHYREALRIIDKLDKSRPGNEIWQLDLVDCYIRSARVTMNVADALDALQRSRAILPSLVAVHGGNPDWQHQLAIEYTSIGDLLAANYKRDALDAYQRSLEIIGRLADTQRDASESQAELAMEYYRIGNVSDVPAAKKAALDEALKIADMLQRNHKLPDALQTLPYELRLELSKLHTSGK